MATYNRDSIELSIQALRDGIAHGATHYIAFSGAMAASAVMALQAHDFTAAANELKELYQREAFLTALRLTEDERARLSLRESFLLGAKTMWKKYAEEPNPAIEIQTEDHIETFGGLLGGAADRGVIEARRKHRGVETE